MVAADRAVMHLRARLLESVRRNEAGEDPIGLGVHYTTVRALTDTTVPVGDRWQDLVPGNIDSLPAPASA